jgi:Flp pilus assembly protein TadD
MSPAELGRLRDRAIALHRAGKPAEARPLYAAFLSAVPQDAAMWSNYGSLLRSEGRHDLSVLAQERAYALQPEGLAQMGNLANALADVGQYERALELRHAVLRRTPDDNSQKAMIGKALRTLGRYEEGIAWLEQAVADHPDVPELRIQLSLTELAAGRYASGFHNFGVRWQTGELKPRKIAFPQWQGEDLTGKTILVMPEQGFGDAVTFSRFLPVLRRYNPAAVRLFCEPPLVRLLERVEGADWTGNEIGPDGSHDVWTNIMDLPAAHFAQSSEIPAPTRLTVPADSQERARVIVSPFRDRFKVGVVWCGSVTYRGNAFRSFSHTEFHRLLDLPGVQLFSLYKGPELAAFHADGTAGFIVDAAASDRDFADCAAMMMEMDLIVTSDTVTAHLAGSLGRPVWTLLHWDAFWLWQLERDSTPWYPGMRLIRQERPRDWAGVMARVRQDIAAMVQR